MSEQREKVYISYKTGDFLVDGSVEFYRGYKKRMDEIGLKVLDMITEARPELDTSGLSHETKAEHGLTPNVPGPEKGGIEELYFDVANSVNQIAEAYRKIKANSPQTLDKSMESIELLMSVGNTVLSDIRQEVGGDLPKDEDPNEKDPGYISGTVHSLTNRLYALGEKTTDAYEQIPVKQTEENQGPGAMKDKSKSTTKT